MALIFGQGEQVAASNAKHLKLLKGNILRGGKDLQPSFNLIDRGAAIRSWHKLCGHKRRTQTHTNESQRTKFVSNGAVQRAMDFLITTVISTTSLLGAAVEVDAGLTDSHSQCP